MKSKIVIHPELMDFKRPSPHSIFSPSGADRWMACPFSVKACKDIPEETSEYAEEGTLAHLVCEAYFREQYLGIPFPHDLNMQLLGYDSAEMLMCAAGYFEVVNYWLKNKETIGDVIWFGLEKGIPIFPDKKCFGTADCIIIGTKGMVIIDYKHGKGKNVAANSLQLRVYMAGAVRYMSNIPENYNFHTVVYQPRTDMAPKEATYLLSDLVTCLDNIWAAITESEKDGLSPVEGNHCFWCPARRTKDLNLKCPAIKEKPLKLAQENFAKFFADMNAPIQKLSDPNPARDQAIIKLMALYPLIKKTVEDCTEEIKMRLQEGEVIEGIRMIDEVGNRTLNAETDDDAAKLIASRFPVNPWKIIPETKKLRTITELEKELGKNKLDSICVRKVKKKLDIADGKIRDILGEMSAFGKMIKLEEDV
jgi:hypothetical protein